MLVILPKFTAMNSCVVITVHSFINYLLLMVTVYITTDTYRQVNFLYTALIWGLLGLIPIKYANFVGDKTCNDLFTHTASLLLMLDRILPLSSNKDICSRE